MLWNEDFDDCSDGQDHLRRARLAQDHSVQGGGHGAPVPPVLQSGHQVFHDRHHGSEVRSWVNRGDNQPIEPRGLEEALGADAIEALTRQTGLSRDELLSRLSAVLPTAVDRMTPEGREPTPEEEARWRLPSAA